LRERVCNPFGFGSIHGLSMQNKFKTAVRLICHVQHSNGIKSERCLIFPERRDVLLPSTRRETLKTSRKGGNLRL
jgi:hypothetical protein